MATELSESVKAGNIKPGNQQVNVMRSFISDYTFEVHHVAHHGIFSGNTHTTQHLACVSGNFCCYFTAVSFCHGNLSRCSPLFIHKGSEPPVEQLGFGDFGNHFSQFLLLQLEASYGFVELNPFFTVPECCIIAIHGSTNSTPCDSISGFVQTAKRASHSPNTGKNIFFWNFYVVKNQFPGSAGTQAPFTVCGGSAEAFHTSFHNQTTNHSFFILSPYYCDIGIGGITNPHFGAIKNNMATCILNISKHACRIGTMVGFC